jgi:hypothetical protein
VLWGDVVRGADRRRFGAEMGGVEKVTEEMDGQDEEGDYMDLDVPEVSNATTSLPISSHHIQKERRSPTQPKPKPTPRARQESPKKSKTATTTTKPPDSASGSASKRSTKKTVREVVQKSRGGRASKPTSKNSRGTSPGRVGYSTLAYPTPAYLTSTYPTSSSKPTSTSASAQASTRPTRTPWPDEEYEDFSALMDQIGDVSDEDGDSTDGVAAALRGVSLASPKRFRYL